MKLKLKYSFLIAILSMILYSCEKEYSLEGSKIGGTSVFTFTGAPGACVNPVVTGNYNVGTALDSTHTVTISVVVTSPGTYYASTATVNGISFSGSGSFTAIGTQTIVLTGSGTPIDAGVYSFTPGSSGCSFAITVSGTGSGGTAVYTLSGAPGNCTSFSPSGVYAAGTPLAASNFVTVSVDVTTIGTYIITTNSVNGMVFSGTGEFTATGTQTVQLPGSGTPLAGGTFQFTPATNGCTFSITVTGSSSGTSVFTYEGAPGNCTTATPTGTYTAGTALTAVNTVTISVNVTTIGTWSITTPTSNGFSFSGAGTFTTTGVQNVTLTGSGTPTAAGVAEFTPPNGCLFLITVEGATTGTDFLKCTIDGVARAFNINLSGDNSDPATLTINGDETSGPQPNSLNISLTKPTGITAGTYNKISFTNTTTYCIVSYLDGADPNNVWLTGIATSTAEFTVIVTHFAGNRAEGTFSGTLYSDPITGTGAKVFTDGQFSVAY